MPLAITGETAVSLPKTTQRITTACRARAYWQLHTLGQVSGVRATTFLSRKRMGIRSSNLLIKVLRNSWRHSISVVTAGLKLSLPKALSDATESSPNGHPR